MRLSEKQADFLLDMAYLVQHINAFDAGRYYCTAGDYYRDPRVHGKQGEKKSYSAGTSGHKNRLAADLNIYFDGKYLEDTEDYKPLGIIGKPLTTTTGGVEILITTGTAREMTEIISHGHIGV